MGQKQIMSNLVKNYNPNTAPSIAVPYKGHTYKNDQGLRVTTSQINVNTGQSFASARDLIARDIKELRRVYPDIPNKKLQELINLNKKMYPEVNVK